MVRVKVAHSRFSATCENQSDQETASRDPLRADEVMARLPEMNRRQDTATLLAEAKRLATGHEVTTPADARAALRDLGFLVSSAVRHSPDCELSDLEPELLRLGALAGEVPRDNVYSYTTRNPTGPRRRSFTGTEEEELFISCVARATISLNEAVAALNATLDAEDGDGPSSSESLATALHTCRTSVRILRNELLAVKRRISPQTFSTQLRPYFPEVRLGERTYMAPGGAQMPLLVLDALLFTGSSQDPELTEWHREYLRENVKYLPPAHREVCAKAVARADESGARYDSQSLGARAERDTETRTLFRGLLEDVLRFRYPHRQLARANMRVRVEGARGSGGYTDEVLNHIIAVNQNALHGAEVTQ